MVDQIMKMPEGLAILLLAPLVVDRKGEQAEVFEQLRGQGFVRARIDGRVHELDALPKIDPKKKHTIEAVVDRLRIRAGRGARAWPNRSRPRSSSRAAPRASRPTMQRSPQSPRTKRCSPRARPARCAATACRRSSRRCFRSTVRRAPAPPATASGLKDFFDPAARRRLSTSVARGRRHQELGSQELVLLRADHRDGEALQVRSGDAVGRPVEEGPAGDAVRQRQRRNRIPLRARQWPHHEEETSLRRHHSEPRAALQGNRFAARARRTREVPRLAALPRLPAARGSTARRAMCSSARTACPRSRI